VTSARFPADGIVLPLGDLGHRAAEPFQQCSQVAYLAPLPAGHKRREPLQTDALQALHFVAPNWRKRNEPSPTVIWVLPELDVAGVFHLAQLPGHQRAVDRSLVGNIGGPDLLAGGDDLQQVKSRRWFPLPPCSLHTGDQGEQRDDHRPHIVLVRFHAPMIF